MNIRSHLPMLETGDIDSTIQFYTSLGFVLENRAGNGESENCILKWDLARVMFIRARNDKPSAAKLLLEVNDVTAFFNQTKSKTAAIDPIQEIYNGISSCRIIDNNGHELYFGKPTVPNPFDKWFPENFSLETPRVLLKPLKKEDFESLQKLTAPEIIWKYFARELSDPAELRQWIEDAMLEKAACKRMPFTITDKDDNSICGSTSYGNISFYDKRIEIGWSWLGADYMGTGVNRHTKFALLSYAFEVMKMERVEIKTDYLNERSKAALIKVGMKPEGVLHSHMLMSHGRRRDSIYYGMMREEWEERKENFFGDLI